MSPARAVGTLAAALCAGLLHGCAGLLHGCAGLLHGCASADTAPAGWTPPKQPELLEVYQAVGGGAVLELRYTGLGAPFRGAIGDPLLLEPLGAALDGCVQGSRALVATWDEAAKVGRLVLSIPSARWRCRGDAGDEGVDLLPLDPALRALDAWRKGLAEAHDGRLALFDLGLHVEDGQGGVTLWRAPDGRVGRCAVVDGRERCAEGAAPVTHLKLPGAQARVEALLGVR